MFPVEFQIDLAVEAGTREFFQAFTRDIGQGGLCLEFNAVPTGAEPWLQKTGTALKLIINPPFSRLPIEARGAIVWHSKSSGPGQSRWFIGVSYTHIEPVALSRLMRFAHRQVWLPRLIWAAALIMLGAIAWLSVREHELMRENQALVRSLVQSAEKRSDVSQNLQDLRQRREGLEKTLIEARQTIQQLRESLRNLSQENQDQKTAYEKQLDEMMAKQKEATEALHRVRSERRALEVAAQRIDNAQAPALQAALEQMVDWIRSHQNLKTGLVASFEGDLKQADAAYTYDQSLASQVFTLFGDMKRAELILNFYDRRAKSEDGAFYNGYGAHDGLPVENVLHAGPNIWMGIAALQYEHRFRSGKYSALALRIGEWVLGQLDREGGLPGGPHVTWYSTEHNLDAYAFLGMLYRQTGDGRWRDAQEKVLAWIQKYSFSLQAKRVNRGKGDATIATDTMSWSIAAIGPETLTLIGFMPEDIMAFAEKQCEVQTTIQSGDGHSLKVRGFDFSKAEHVGRGGVISTEWTAQMVVSYQVLARWFREQDDTVKAQRYSDRARFYLNELKKMVITSPSKTGQGRGCLPYASASNADTGHGWRTPEGRDTGSVAGTAYGIFAWQNFNPFEFPERDSHAGA